MIIAHQRIDQIGAQLGDRLAQMSTLLSTFQSVANKINQGQGTAGQLVNDPKLYEGLVETTRQLNATIADLQRLVQQWEEEGVSVRVGG